MADLQARVLGFQDDMEKAVQERAFAGRSVFEGRQGPLDLTALPIGRFFGAMAPRNVRLFSTPSFLFDPQAGSK